MTLESAHPAARRPAAGGLPDHRAHRAAARASRRTGSRSWRSSPRGSSRWRSSSSVADRAARRSVETTVTSSLFTWIPAGDFQVDVGFFVDNLTACLLIVVTTIGLLVHVYSIGYMSHDPGYWRFFAYLNLFMFSMLLLVLAEQLPRRVRRLGAGRPVELPADRLLVSQASAALAAKKAFIVNRVGDVGFALGIMLIFASARHARHPAGHRT